jgi:hypothetical protein
MRICWADFTLLFLFFVFPGVKVTGAMVLNDERVHAFCSFVSRHTSLVSLDALLDPS